MDHILEALTDVMHERAGLPLLSRQEIRQGISDIKQMGMYEHSFVGLPPHILNTPASTPKHVLKQQLHIFHDQNPIIDEVFSACVGHHGQPLPPGNTGLVLEGEYIDHSIEKVIPSAAREPIAPAARATTAPAPSASPPRTSNPVLPVTTAANQSESWMARLGKEKWMGKKGAATLGVTAAIGAIGYALYKLGAQQKDTTWQNRVSQPPLNPNIVAGPQF